MTGPAGEPLRVGLAGLGAIGMVVARRLDAGVDGFVLSAVSARDLDGASERVAGFATPPDVMPAGALAAHADVVVECAPQSAFVEIVEPAAQAGRTIVVVSVGALLDRLDLVDLAAANGGRIVVATGALIGLDAVRAAAQGEIASVAMVTRKPPGSLAGAPYLVERGIELDGLDEPLKVYDGPAGAAAKAFPASLNVAAALSLAGIGPDRTRLEIWADPGVTRNSHSIAVEADAARFTMAIESVPSSENPRTGRLTPLSVIATLRGLVDPLRVGT